ncbi:MAG TPA: hypothetical protein PK074_09360, partial [Spirochaetales bacterium]|nr:hypothetical protein [Spirochaetales bacterium]
MILVMVIMIGLVPAIQIQAESEFGNTISAGGIHTMAIKTDGSLWGWGANEYGQVGDGTVENRLAPVKIMDGVVSVYTAWNYTMAIKADGSLWGWGANEYGQVGDGTVENRLAP